MSVKTSLDQLILNCIDNKNAWVIKLGKDSSDNMYLPKTFRKASASQLYLREKFIILSTNHRQDQINVAKVQHLFVQ